MACPLNMIIKFNDKRHVATGCACLEEACDIIVDNVNEEVFDLNMHGEQMESITITITKRKEKSGI